MCFKIKIVLIQSLRTQQNKQTDRQTDRQTNKKTNKQNNIQLLFSPAVFYHQPI